MKTTVVGICTNAISGLFHSQGKCARRKINWKTVKREDDALRQFCCDNCPKLKVFWVNAESTWMYNALDALKVFYRKMSAQEYEHSVAERKMAIARTALETIANAETDPGVRTLARETLEEFTVLSDGDKFKGFFLGAQQGDAIAEVDPTDLRRFHENMSERSREAGPGVAIGLGALAPSTSGADTGPLCVRNWLLGIMSMQGLLADWQQGTELDGSVYRVAATIPVNGVRFDPEAFVTRLRAERGT